MSLAIASAAPTALAQAPARRRRYVIVGCGSRHRMYRNAIETAYKDHAELVALCDLHPAASSSPRNSPPRTRPPCPRVTPTPISRR